MTCKNCDELVEALFNYQIFTEQNKIELIELNNKLENQQREVLIIKSILDYSRHISSLDTFMMNIPDVLSGLLGLSECSVFRATDEDYNLVASTLPRQKQLMISVCDKRYTNKIVVSDGKGEAIYQVNMKSLDEIIVKEEYLIWVLNLLIDKYVIIKGLTHLANTDALTQSKNRFAFQNDIQEALRLYDSQDKHFALAIIDIDNFKAINDNHGHSSGDLFLQETCNILRKTIRATDDVYRLGGDEFAVILRNTKDRYAIFKKMEDIRKSVALLRVNGNVSTTCSIGLCLSGDTNECIIDLADKMLYIAKEKRNKCTLYEPSIDLIHSSTPSNC